MNLASTSHHVDDTNMTYFAIIFLNIHVINAYNMNVYNKYLCIYVWICGKHTTTGLWNYPMCRYQSYIASIHWILFHVFFSLHYNILLYIYTYIYIWWLYASDTIIDIFKTIHQPFAVTRRPIGSAPKGAVWHGSIFVPCRQCVIQAFLMGA